MQRSDAYSTVAAFITIYGIQMSLYATFSPSPLPTLGHRYPLPSRVYCQLTISENIGVHHYFMTLGSQVMKMIDILRTTWSEQIANEIFAVVFNRGFVLALFTMLHSVDKAVYSDNTPLIHCKITESKSACMYITDCFIKIYPRRNR